MPLNQMIFVIFKQLVSLSGPIMLSNRDAFNKSRNQSDALDTFLRITADTKLTRAQTADASVVLFRDGTCNERGLNLKA